MHHVIGHLKRGSDGGYTGYLTTLAATDPIALVPRANVGDVKEPDTPNYRVTRPGIADIGRAWHAPATNGRVAIVTLDDPTFRAPLRAHLIHTTARAADLVWVTSDN